MVKLTDRLQIIADRLAMCETMADIGTDHGFLPVYMLQSGRSSKTIAADISAASLDKASQLCQRLNIKDCDLRVGDGLKVLDVGEAEGIAIAGMGGNLMVNILEASIDVASSVKRLVMQPRTDSDELRRWLLSHDFSIVAEDVVYEGKFVPVIITAVPNSKLDQDADGVLSVDKPNTDGSIYYEVPYWMTEANGPIEEHISRILSREKHILNGLEHGSNIKADSIEDKRKGIEYLEKMIEKVGARNG